MRVLVADSKPMKSQTMPCEIMAAEWLALFNSTVSSVVNNKSFRRKYDELDQKFKKLSDQDKIRFHNLIHASVKVSLQSRKGNQQ